MPYRSLFVLPICWLIGGFGSPQICYGDRADQHPANALTFKLAPGLTIEPVATESLIRWPTLVDWDAQGHLLVVESAGVTKPIEQHNERLLHRIVRLVDEDGDGKMDRRTLVADKLPFSEGILCLGDTILVSAPPVIWKLTDPDKDGYCEQREAWFDGKTLTGCANDLHGPYFGRDGWIYWCKGAFAHQTHELPDGKVLSDGAAHIFRRRLTGGPIEPVMSGGMDNPVGFAVLPSGERFFCGTFLVHPGDGKRDGVAHAIYGGAYGKDHSALDGVPRTGSLMPIMVHLGPAAPSGMTCLRSNLLGDGPTVEGSPAHDVGSTLAVALFNLQKVVALPLSESGATYQTRPIDLVVGSRIDFHPTDVIEDSDGSLLVVDTGGWYDLCCPTSRIDQQTAPGGIYRLRQNNSETVKSIRTEAILWDTLSADQIAEHLDDRRPWIARLALLKIGSAGQTAIPVLARRTQDPHRPMASRQNSLWALGAIGSETALEAVERIVHLESEVDLNRFRGEESSLESIACHLIALHRYRPAKTALEKLLTDLVGVGMPTESANPLPPNSLALARVAVEALGRVGDQQSVRCLMDHCGAFTDGRVLDHSIRYALFEIGDADAVAQYLDSQDVRQRELALATLDLLKAESHLSVDVLVSSGLVSELAPVVVDLLAKRPQLAASVLARLGPTWIVEMENQPPSELFVRLASVWRDIPAMQQWIGKSFGPPASEEAWQWIEVAFNSNSGSSIPESWHSWIVSSLDVDVVRMTELLSSVDLGQANSSVLVEGLIDRARQQSDDTLKEALVRSLPPRHLYEDDDLAVRCIDSMRTSSPGNQAWHILMRLKISENAARKLMEICGNFGPSDLLHTLEVVTSAADEKLDQQMLALVADHKAARAMPLGSLTNVYRQRNESIRKAAQNVADQIERSDSNANAILQSVIDQLPEGNPVDGLALFHGPKAGCGACHQIGYRGGKIGPELTRIGSSRTREALLEAVLFPSQRIEQGFQSTQILTIDGKVINGIVTPQSTGKDLELRLSADKIEHVSMDDVEQMSPSEVSIMPSGMLELLNHQELADLLSLLEASR